MFITDFFCFDNENLGIKILIGRNRVVVRAPSSCAGMPGSYAGRVGGFHFFFNQRT